MYTENNKFLFQVHMFVDEKIMQQCIQQLLRCIQEMLKSILIAQQDLFPTVSSMLASFRKTTL